jgi:lycopene beta-cyclase
LFNIAASTGGRMVYDFVFVGGGLSTALAVLALQWRRPDASVAVIEQETQLGGNHTWCFHARDVPRQAAAWLEPLVVQRWPAYGVRFPRRTRVVSSPYACVTSARLHQVLSAHGAARPRLSLRLGARAREVGAHAVMLEDGALVQGTLVIDGRGPSLAPPSIGYQKFLGLELQVAPRHALREPIVMDATVPQRDGLRFMYALPLGERVLIEDTYFSDTPALDEAHSVDAVHAYAEQLGLQVRAVLRQEQGVLPMPSGGARPRVTGSPIRAGYRGGYFHPTTGYSFPLALRFAEALAGSDPRALRGSALDRLAQEHARQLPLLFWLTHTMFTWFAPEQRFRVLEHFYRLPEPLIERFYAAELTALDKLRLFFGPPPRGLSLRRALSLPTGATA